MLGGDNLGIIIVDGKAALRFKGPISGFAKSLVAIETVPLPEKIKNKFKIELTSVAETQMRGLTIQIGFKELSITEFAEYLTKLEIAIQKIKDMGYWIDVCPPSPLPIGPLPAPKEEILTGWTITAKVK